MGEVGGDRAVTGQLTGQLVVPEQGGRGHGDLDVRAAPVIARQVGPFQGGIGHVSEHIGAQLAHRAEHRLRRSLWGEPIGGERGTAAGRAPVCGIDRGIAFVTSRASARSAARA